MTKVDNHLNDAQDHPRDKDYEKLHALMQNVQDLEQEIRVRRGMTEHFRRKSYKLQKVIDNYEAGEETRRQSAERLEEKINALQELLVSTSQKLYALGYAVRTLTTLEVAKSGALLEHAGISEEDLLNAGKYAEGAPIPPRPLSLPRDRVLVESRALTEDAPQQPRDPISQTSRTLMDSVGLTDDDLLKARELLNAQDTDTKQT